MYCRRFFKDLSHIALDKKSNFEYLERDIGLHKFLPAAVITAHKVYLCCLAFNFYEIVFKLYFCYLKKKIC